MIIDLNEVAKRVGEFRIQVKDTKDDVWHDWKVEGFNAATYLGRDGAETDARTVKACGKYHNVKIVQINKDYSSEEHPEDCSCNWCNGFPEVTEN